MTQTPSRAGAGTQPATAEGVARAVEELTQQAGGMARQEIASARNELLDKLRADVPAAALLGGAALFSVLTVASVHSWTLELLSRRFGRAGGAFGVLVLDGAAAGVTAFAGARALRRAPAPLPTESARHAQQTVVDVRDGVQADTGHR